MLFGVTRKAATRFEERAEVVRSPLGYLATGAALEPTAIAIYNTLALDVMRERIRE